MARGQAEIGFGGGLRAGEQRAVGNAVEVSLKDLFLTVPRLQAEGGEYLGKLAPEGARPRLQRAGQLLRYGGSAGNGAPALGVLQEGARDRAEVHAGIGEEALVLGGHGGQRQPARNILQLHRHAAPRGLPVKASPQLPPVVVRHPRRSLRLQPGIGGQRQKR